MTKRVKIKVSNATIKCPYCGHISKQSFEDTGEDLGLNPLAILEEIWSFFLDRGITCPHCKRNNKKYGHVKSHKQPYAYAKKVNDGEWVHWTKKKKSSIYR